MKKEKKEKDNTVKYGTISLPIPLINLIKEKIKGTGLPSVSAYVALILREIIASSEDKEPLSKENEEEIRIKLRKLGYL
jgi:hypothetical protein